MAYGVQSTLAVTVAGTLVLGRNGLGRVFNNDPTVRHE
jgi:hypothetical protein